MHTFYILLYLERQICTFFSQNIYIKLYLIDFAQHSFKGSQLDWIDLPTLFTKFDQGVKKTAEKSCPSFYLHLHFNGYNILYLVGELNRNLQILIILILQLIGFYYLILLHPMITSSAGKNTSLDDHKPSALLRHYINNCTRSWPVDSLASLRAALSFLKPHVRWMSQ